MRRRFVPLVAALLFLPGCHELWIGSYSSGETSSDAETNVRAAIPAVEAYFADNGTYVGMTVEGLRATYDQGIRTEVSIVRAKPETYCIESTVAQDTYSKHGPGGDIVSGGC